VFSSADTFDDWFAAPFKGQGEDVTGQLREEEQLLIINRLHQVRGRRWGPGARQNMGGTRQQ
jgi:hypothetical protein